MINAIGIVNRNQLFITPHDARGYQMKLVRCMFKTDTGDAYYLRSCGSPCYWMFHMLKL